MPDRRSLRLLPLLLGLACTAPSTEPTAPATDATPSGAALDPNRFEILDLTYAFDQDTLYWPTSTERFDHRELAFGETEQGYFYSSYSLSTPEHGGTHLDAPSHFDAGGWTVDRIPVERLLAPAVVIDVREQAAADPDYRLTSGDLEAWEAEHGQVPTGSLALLLTGWGRFWPDAKSYLGDDTAGDASQLHFPSFGEEAARVLVGERGVIGLGVDTASIDHGPSTGFEVHQVAGAGNVFGLENIANLERLPATGAWLIALPMKIGAGSGGPVRIVALLPVP